MGDVVVGNMNGAFVGDKLFQYALCVVTFFGGVLMEWNVVASHSIIPESMHLGSFTVCTFISIHRCCLEHTLRTFTSDVN